MVEIRTSTPSTLVALESPVHTPELRPYLGMSQIGHSCMRYLWYYFRWAFKDSITDRQRRLFERGHDEEDKIIRNLNRVGIEVYGEQAEIVSGWGHIKGHCDGMCMGVLEAPKTEHLAEFKTMNDKAFKEVCKKKVQASKPVYYAQCQYGMLKFKLKRTLFVAVNKNDDAYYIERIKLDKDFGEELDLKGKAIILAATPPEKQFKSTWYECKWCAARLICHFNAKWEMNCRTCKNVSPTREGTWWCDYHETVVSTEEQRKGCLSYEVIGNET